MLSSVRCCGTTSAQMGGLAPRSTNISDTIPRCIPYTNTHRKSHRETLSTTTIKKRIKSWWKWLARGYSLVMKDETETTENMHSWTHLPQQQEMDVLYVYDDLTRKITVDRWGRKRGKWFEQAADIDTWRTRTHAHARTRYSANNLSIIMIWTHTRRVLKARKELRKKLFLLLLLLLILHNENIQENKQSKTWLNTHNI